MAATISALGVTLPRIKTVNLDDPWRWLAAGWQDLRAAPAVGLAYGAVFTLLGYLLTALIWVFDIFYLVLPLIAGFLLLGPILAVGLYDVSRRLEERRPVSLASSLAAWRDNLTQIALMGLGLSLTLFVWLQTALLIFAVFFVDNPPRPEPLFILDVFLSAESLPFLAVGTLVGGVIAAVVFACSAVSIPLLLDRRVNIVTAVATSFEAVRQNFWTMALWAWLIVLFVGAGLVTFYLGLAVTLPLIGHATWHAYRALVAD